MMRLFSQHTSATAAGFYLRARMLTLRGWNTRVIFKCTRFNRTRQKSTVHFERGTSPLPVSWRLIAANLPQLATSSFRAQTMNGGSLGTGPAQDRFR